MVHCTSMFSSFVAIHLFDPFYYFSTAQQLLPHPPHIKHQLPDEEKFFVRDLDYELSIRDDDLFERFYDDLD
jgi:hypothetical protein